MKPDRDPVLCNCGEPAEVATPAGAKCAECASELAGAGWDR